MAANDEKPGAERVGSVEVSAQEPILGSRVGRLVSRGAHGVLQVDFEGNPQGPVPARAAVALTPEEWERAVNAHQSVVLLFEKGDPGLPLVMGVVQAPSETPLLDVMLEERAAKGGPVELRVDGQPRTVKLEAQDELVLRCGKSSVTLRSDGKIVIRGTQVETRASGVNRIKGGSVQIN
ncbi:DUF6484 domain-containing protein [Myxococcus landrumensis]|uniref:DUF6484 domain-containing protein n=1 Tax=Myxococcus landrumensis TaxID=2813577 RepID=A0ABX7N1B2_9BACT|nr:DUF6484 domain-containing protein [Myxococcus landrumus]QSQ12500.1 hypothetical protein JY572_29645 [Myxococcus landrumus]